MRKLVIFVFLLFLTSCYGTRLPVEVINVIEEEDNNLCIMQGVQYKYKDTRKTYWQCRLRVMDQRIVGEFDNYQMTRDHVNILRKKEKDLKAFKIPPKVYPRKDGSTLVVEKAILEPIVLGNTVAYKYNIYDVIYEEDRPILRKRVIYSDNDFIYSNIQEIQYVLLDEKNIADSIKNRSGYIGYINELGDLTHSMALSMFFSKRSNFTIEDFERMNKHTR